MKDDKRKHIREQLGKELTDRLDESLQGSVEREEILNSVKASKTFPSFFPASLAGLVAFNLKFSTALVASLAHL